MFVANVQFYCFHSSDLVASAMIRPKIDVDPVVSATQDDNPSLSQIPQRCRASYTGIIALSP
jgi:hypothetical protein